MSDTVSPASANDHSRNASDAAKSRWATATTRIGGARELDPVHDEWLIAHEQARRVGGPGDRGEVVIADPDAVDDQVELADRDVVLDEVAAGDANLAHEPANDPDRIDVGLDVERLVAERRRLANGRDDHWRDERRDEEPDHERDQDGHEGEEAEEAAHRSPIVGA